MPKTNSSSRHTLFVGGVEVTDETLSLEEAQRLYNTYKEDGYDDIQVVEV